jgi:hypothetical protein
MHFFKTSMVSIPSLHPFPTSIQVGIANCIVLFEIMTEGCGSRVPCADAHHASTGVLKTERDRANYIFCLLGCCFAVTLVRLCGEGMNTLIAKRPLLFQEPDDTR